MSSPFDNDMHRELQRCGHALYKISKRFDHWVGSKEPMRYHEIWVGEAFQIFYIATTLTVLVPSHTRGSRLIAVKFYPIIIDNPSSPVRARYWVSVLIVNSNCYVLLQSVLCCVQKNMILDRVIAAPDCTMYKFQKAVNAQLLCALYIICREIILRQHCSLK